MSRPSKPAPTGRSTGKSPAKSAARLSAPSRADQARAGIGSIMAGVRLAPSATSPDARAGGGSSAPAPRHPVGSGVAFERVEDVYRMDPRKIVLEGPYVRQFLEDAAFHQLRAAVEAEGDIGQHLGVRLVGPPTDRRRVLVYGMRRWKAALAAGLERVPVRDYGPITEERALELQLLENEIRADPHPVDTALGFHLLAKQEGWNQARIARVFDKNKGYVSEMVRAGEAVAQLADADRQALYTAPRVTVRAFQALAQIRDVAARAAALQALAAEPAADEETRADPAGPAGGEDGANDPGAQTAPPARPDPAERRRMVDEAVFHARPLRDGRSFRVRWTDDDLRRDGARVAEEFRRHFLAEYEHLLHRAAVLGGHGAGQGGTPPRIAELVASAAQETARVDARFAAGPGPSAAGPGGAPRSAGGAGA